MDASLLIGIIGVLLSLGFGILSWFIYKESKRKEKQFEYLLKLADLNIKKDIDEGELNNLKNEISLLQSKIKEEIPKEAKKAILKDRLNDAYTNLTNFHKEVRSISKELESLQETNDIPQALLDDIEKEIQPKYLIKEKISLYQTLLTILTACAAISFALPFAPITWWIGIVFALFAIFPISQLIKNFNKLEIKFSTNKNVLHLLGLFMMVVGCIFCIIMVILMAYLALSEKDRDVDIIIFPVVFGLLFLGALIGQIYLITRLYKKLTVK